MALLRAAAGELAQVLGFPDCFDLMYVLHEGVLGRRKSASPRTVAALELLCLTAVGSNIDLGHLQLCINSFEAPSALLCWRPHLPRTIWYVAVQSDLFLDL